MTQRSAWTSWISLSIGAVVVMALGLVCLAYSIVPPTPDRRVERAEERAAAICAEYHMGQAPWRCTTPGEVLPLEERDPWEQRYSVQCGKPCRIYTLGQIPSSRIEDGFGVDCSCLDKETAPSTAH